tara:strand:- start:50 stop:460 length:411 start_codon:yes stop_codon:yes gene_type:complete
MFDWTHARPVPIEDSRLVMDQRELIHASWVMGSVNCTAIGNIENDRKQVQVSWDFAQGFQILGPGNNCLNEFKLGMFPTLNLVWKIENSPWIKQWAQSEAVFRAAWEKDTSHWALFTEDASVHIIAVSTPVIMEQM